MVPRNTITIPRRWKKQIGLWGRPLSGLQSAKIATNMWRSTRKVKRSTRDWGRGKYILQHLSGVRVTWVECKMSGTTPGAAWPYHILYYIYIYIYIYVSVYTAGRSHSCSTAPGRLTTQTLWLFPSLSLDDPLETLQSRFGDEPVKFPSVLSPSRDCGPQQGRVW